jgi:hypothetical protein
VQRKNGMYTCLPSYVHWLHNPVLRPWANKSTVPPRSEPGGVVWEFVCENNLVNVRKIFPPPHPFRGEEGSIFVHS